MAIIYGLAINVFNIVDHQLRVRQEQTPTMSTATQDTGTSTNSITTPTQTSNMISGPQSGGPTSSPLLFFVALGFGVVFTNLWIIVGVKYCFRYNARNRAMRSGNDVDLDNLHTRPHRRRREKRLMTMDEVNERFPLMKYKTWAASRARQGLPTSGGVSRPPSCSPSEITPDECLEPSSRTTEIPEEQSKPTDSVTKVNPTSDSPSLIISEKRNHEAIEISEKNTHSKINNESDQPDKNLYPQPVVNPDGKKVSVVTEDEEDEEDDQIHIAVSPELLTTPGDSCAICIDTLEEEDEVRGLSCGHAFHASCIDPWLTSRRACCPLCKADFYIPKVRSDAENIEAERLIRRSDGPTMSQHPQSVWTSIVTSTRLIRSRINLNEQTNNQNTSSNNNFSASTTGQTITVTEISQPRRNGFSLSNTVRGFRLPILRIHRRNQSTTEEPNNNTSTSPSQLEAGARR
ncbi:putative ring-8 protein [Erysiphe neolycopersici]|uniref:Putative ring-8 protein n=1 Tax=Erysiphe neolycopersici TaxID=212602 RepID=A0A420HH26_9PEZI|nr:putative ring-8 protein [Erysiphe neolycopersici]